LRHRDTRVQFVKKAYFN